MERFSNSMSAVTPNYTDPESPIESSVGHPTTAITNRGTTPLHLDIGNDGQTSTDDKTISDSEKDFIFSKLPRRSKYILLLCSMSTFFVSASFSILAPFFPKEAEKKGLSTTTVGLIFSVFELVIFISSPVFGNYLTRIGTKFVLISGICVGGCCSVLFGLLDKSPPGVTFAALCFACRSLEALALSAFITSSFAILSNEFPKNVATALGITETASGIGMMVGPAIGGGLYELNGYGLPFFVLGSLIIICGMVLASFLPKVQGADTKRKGSVFKLLASPMSIISLMSMFMCSLGLGFLNPTLAKHLEPYNLSTAVVGLMFVIGPALYAMGSPFLGYLVDNKNLVGSVLIVGHLMYGIAFFLVGPSPWLPFLPSMLWLVTIGLVLFGLGIGCVAVPNIKCLVLAALDLGFEDNLDTYAIVSGLFNSTFSLGGFVGPTLGGVMVDHIGFDSSSSIIGAVNLVLCVVAFLFFARRHLVRRRKPTGTDSHPPLENGQGDARRENGTEGYEQIEGHCDG